MKLLTRRNFLELSVLGCGSLLLPRWAGASKAAPTPDPRFFIQIFLQGGADASYMFDARPLAMTTAGKIQNYLGEEPVPFTGLNGTSCLATSLTKPLWPYRDRFTIINGMYMSASFPGHLQNANYAFTGNPFGGESFLPHLNLPTTGAPTAAVDSVAAGFLAATLTNTSGTVPVDPQAIGPLKNKLANLPRLDGGSEFGNFLRGRFQANSAGTGHFSSGSRKMLNGFDQIFSLSDKLTNVAAPDPNDDNEKQFVTFLAGAFKNSVARSALWVINPPVNTNFDTHAYSQAKVQPQLFSEIGLQLARIFKALTEVPYDDKHSLLDVTTVMITSEFSRSMRQHLVPFDQTGTDHNQFTNSAIIAGNGIRGGLVLGASDFASATETLSKAHLSLDQDLKMTMGRPFDFAKLQPRVDLPDAFDIKDYLTVGSVVNTIYQMFGVPATHYRTLDRSGTVAPVLNGLLV